MTLDEKLEQFYQAAIESATNQNLQIIEEYKKSLQVIYDNYKNEVLKKIENAYQEESERLLREKNRELSKEAVKLKQKVSEKTSELIGKLFQEVLKKLTEFKSTPEYFDLLCKQIREAFEFAGGNSMTIYLTSADSNLKSSLETALNTTLTVSTEEFVGGIKAFIQDKNILIDNSFASRIEELKSKFSL